MKIGERWTQKSGRSGGNNPIQTEHAANTGKCKAQTRCGINRKPWKCYNWSTNSEQSSEPAANISVFKQIKVTDFHTFCGKRNKWSLKSCICKVLQQYSSVRALNEIVSSCSSVKSVGEWNIPAGVLWLLASGRRWFLSSSTDSDLRRRKASIYRLNEVPCLETTAHLLCWGVSWTKLTIKERNKRRNLRENFHQDVLHHCRFSFNSNL